MDDFIGQTKTTETQGDTGDAGGQQSGEQTSWTDALPEEIRGHEAISGMASVEDLAKGYLGLKEQAAQHSIPESAEAYQVPIPEGHKVDQAFLQAAKTWAHEAGLSQAQMEAFAGKYLKHEQAAIKAVLDADTKQREALVQEWGDDFELNAALARRAARRFGGEEFISLIESIGLGNDARVLKAFLEIGKAMSEDTLEGGRGSGGASDTRPRTPDGRAMLSYPSMRGGA